MPDPVDYQEYERLSMENTVIDGFGLDVATHTPCPFCAHPEFMVLMPAAGMVPGDDRPSLHDTLQTEHTCEACGRSAKAIVQKAGGSTTFEIVQTGGPDAPEWLNPKPRRIEP